MASAERKRRVLTSSRSTLNKLAVPVVVAVAIAAAAPAQDAPRVGSGALRAVEDLARECERGGRLGEADAIAAQLPALGVDAASVARLREKLAKEKRGVADAKKDQGIGKTARRVAAALAADLPRQSGDGPRRTLARAILWFDDDVAAAHEVFGRTGGADGWLDDAGRARVASRTAFSAAVAQARALEFAIEDGVSTDAIVTAQVQEKGRFARHRGYAVHVFEDGAFATSSLRLALRARALLAWIRSGAFEFEVTPAEAPIVMTPHRQRYLAAIDDCRRRSTLDEQAANAARTATMFADQSHTSVYVLGREEMVAAWMLRQLAPPSRNAIDEGALNLASQLVIGCFEGLVLQAGRKTQRVDEASFYTDANSNQDSYYAYALGRGARHYLLSRGAEGRFDLGRLLGVPPERCAGLPHVQGTAACAYLVELGKSKLLFDALRGRTDKGMAALVTDTLGPAGEQAAIADWLATPRPGLAQQFGLDDAAIQLRRAIDDARKAALGNVPYKLHGTALWNPELDRGCADLLALRQNGPRTAAAAEAQLFATTSAGADPAAAVRAMLTSVRGRTALLDVGTLELGAAFADGQLAVDTGSLRHAVMTDCLVLWPGQNTTDVPTRYAAGEPVPKPGADAAALGYPLTIQLGKSESDAPCTVGLRVAEESTERWVPCHRFDPSHPLPGCEDLLRTYGIIPQAPLAPRTKYVFQVHLDGREIARAVFTTGQ